MFASATLKLTAWYLMIIMIISILFSVILYTVASSELDTRLENLQRSLHTTTPIDNLNLTQARIVQAQTASTNLIIGLLYANLFILGAAGAASYVLARRTLQPIEEAHEAQSRFTSDASHELRTPLASMKAELEVALRDSSITKKELRELAESNLEEVDKLTHLSHGLLQLSRLDYDNISTGPVDLSQAIQDVIERFNGQRERITVSGPKNIQLITNQTHVEELITILVDNALKYSPPGSSVLLTTITQKGMSGLRVENSGSGIEPAALEHIFERFYRGDSSRTSSAVSGNGLGLSLAKKLVELHGGELTASSEPGKQTVFSLLLPNVSQIKQTNQTAA